MHIISTTTNFTPVSGPTPTPATADDSACADVPLSEAEDDHFDQPVEADRCAS